MDFTNKDIRPDYKKIYTDILNKKIPEKKEECKHFLKKANLSSVDIIELNNKLFGINKETEKFDQRHRSYSRLDIIKILDYQKKYQLNNTELAAHFKLSRNTITKWRKMFLT